MRSSRLLVLGALAIVLFSGAVLAQPGSQVSNWTVPPYHRSSADGSLSPMSDISDAAAFVAVTPCRIIDTRFASGTGHGSPALAAGATRAFDMNAGPCTGIPENVAALSLSIAAILPPSNGFLTAWPTGTAQPLFSQLNYIQGQVVANAAIVPVNTSDQLNFFVNTGPTDIYADVNGYFMDGSGTLNDSVTLRVNSNAPGEAAIYGNNTNNTSPTSGTVGVRGVVNSNLNNPSGVLGLSVGSTGINSGVFGQAQSGSNGAAGVVGYGGSGTFPGNIYDFNAFAPAGVKALGRNANGINAFASGNHHAGFFVTVDLDGTPRAEVFLAAGEGAPLSRAISAQQGDVVIVDDLSVEGTKSFVQPHPTDASKQIRYISVEAPKAEIFFRGTAQVERGVTRIAIPDDFRLVAKAGTYSAMVTPVGAMATVAVMAESADGVVVQASRNVKVNYVVYALREGYENHEAIEPNTLFQPMFEGPYTWHENDHAMKLMKQNGTIRPDGTANMEAARQFGWTLKPESENPNKPALSLSE
jgi:hypothetical protein